MNGWLFVVPVTFVASLLLTAAVRAWARRHGIVDRPDGRRKLHGRPVPLWGGVAVYGAAVLGLLAVRLVPGGASLEFTELSTAWVIAAGFVCFVGSIDDCYDLNSRLKLALQIASVLPIVLLGYYVDRIVAFGYPIQLGWLGIPLTVLWLVGCINALNLIDGMDGLASIVGLSTAVMIGVIAASQGHYHVAMMATGADRFPGGLSAVQPAAGKHLSRRLRQHGHRVEPGRAGNPRGNENFGNLGHHGPGRGHDSADVRHRCGHRTAQADRPFV